MKGFIAIGNSVLRGRGKAVPVTQPGGKGRSAVGHLFAEVDTPEHRELQRLENRVCELSQMTVNALAQTVRCYQVNQLWAVGSLPPCEKGADDLEMQIAGLLSNSHLNSAQVNRVTDLLKCVVCLRSLMCGARLAMQIRWILDTMGDAEGAIALVRVVGENSLVLCQRFQMALATEKKQVPMNTDREMIALNAQVTVQERYLRGLNSRSSLPHVQRRLAMAACWCFAVGAEGMLGATRHYLNQEQPK